MVRLAASSPRAAAELPAVCPGPAQRSAETAQIAAKTAIPPRPICGLPDGYVMHQDLNIRRALECKTEAPTAPHVEK